MRFLIAVLGVAVLLSVYYTYSRRDPIVRMQPPLGEAQVSTELPKLFTVPEFSLTDQSGHPVTLGDLKGHVWAADFFYGTCPGPCPIVSANLSQLQKSLGDQDDVRLVSISTDPEQDTPQALSAYAKRFGAGSRWSFLTGDKSEILKLANEGFRLGVTKGQNAADPIIHSTNIALVDRDGVVRGYYGGTDPQKMQLLLRDVRRLLEERK